MISDKIKILRESNGWTQQELADKVDVSNSAVSAWETGVKEPRMGMINKLAKLFNVKVSYIVNDDNDKEYDDDAKKIAEKIKERENLKILFNKIDDLSDEEIERIAKIIELTVPKKEH